jgi:ribonuclease P/MRP protein subunit RPP1
MKFYDLHVQSVLSGGENSIEELAKFAKGLGYSAIAICDYYQNMNTLKELKKKIESIEVDIEVIPGVEIKAKDVKELKETIKKVRDEVLIVIVSGGNYLINRAACEDSRVDILAHPELGRTDSGLDHICARAAAENNVAIEINFREILYSFRKPRSHVFSHISRNIRLCDKFNTPMIICSGAQSIWDMRGARELVSIANILGLDLSKAFAAVTSIPQQIIEDNKKRLEGKKVTEGVEIVE